MLDKFLIQIQDSLQQYEPNEIVIVGNGPSSSEGMKYLSVRENMLFICINKAPKDLVPLFALATNIEFANSLAKTLPKQVPIIVPASFSLGDRFIELKNSQLNYLEGMLNPSIELEFREDFVLITAIQIIEKANLLGHKINLRLFGFDFSISSEVDNGEFEYLNLLLKKQKEIYVREIFNGNYFNKVNILNDFIKPFESSISLDLDKYRDTFVISDKDLETAIDKNNELMRQIFRDSKEGIVQIVAELTNNHLGSTARLEEMIYECKLQGATLIKIQKRDPSTLYSDSELGSPYRSPFGNTLGEYRYGVELIERQIDYLTFICAKLEIPWFTSVLDEPSLKFISKYRPIAIKAPSTISNHRNFLSSIAASKIEYIFVSLGGTDESYVEWVGNKFKSKKLILMQCTSSYPANHQDCNIRVIPQLRTISNKADLFLGYSSHDPGSLACQLAIALGATFLEKHVKLGSIDWVHFDGVALNLELNELRHFTEDLGLAVKILGQDKKNILNSEHHKYLPNLKHN
jgi:N-acetylneuraminate synthase